MPNLSSDRFANRNLRNRSFRNQTLNHVSFQGSDLRGCDFRDAQLVGANFQQVRTGLSPEKLVLWGAIVLLTILIVGQGTTQLIFGVLGQTSESKVWKYVLVFYSFLSVSGAASALSTIQTLGSNWRRSTEVFSATLTGALTGFFYATRLIDDQPNTAIAGALAGAILLFFASVSLHKPEIKMAIATAGAVNGYGAAFLLNATASAFLSTQQFGWGIFFTLTSLVYVALTLLSMKLAARSLRQATATSFKGANLRDARFDTTLRYPDFSERSDNDY